MASFQSSGTELNFKDWLKISQSGPETISTASFSTHALSSFGPVALFVLSCCNSFTTPSLSTISFSIGGISETDFVVVWTSTGENSDLNWLLRASAMLFLSVSSLLSGLMAVILLP